MTSNIDLHMHTRASDGSDYPQELPDKLRAAGVQIFAVTDHDTVDGARAVAALPLDGLTYFPGIEFSCESPAGRCHILGYGCDFDHPAFQGALEEGRRLRAAKLALRLDYLRERFGIILTEAEDAWLRSRNSPGKLHFANILMARGLADEPNEAIRRFFGPLKEENDCIQAGTAVRAILASGGVPVWAHPLGGEGEPRLTREGFEARMELLLGQGIRGMECFYSRYDAGEIAFLRGQAALHSLLVSGGSDYHGVNKIGIDPGQLSADGTAPEKGALTLLAALGTGCD